MSDPTRNSTIAMAIGRERIEYLIEELLTAHLITETPKKALGFFINWMTFRIPLPRQGSQRHRRQYLPRARRKKGKYVYYHCTGYHGKCPTPWFNEAEIAAKLGTVLREHPYPR